VQVKAGARKWLGGKASDSVRGRLCVCGLYCMNVYVCVCFVEDLHE